MTDYLPLKWTQAESYKVETIENGLSAQVDFYQLPDGTWFGEIRGPQGHMRLHNKHTLEEVRAQALVWLNKYQFGRT